MFKKMNNMFQQRKKFLIISFANFLNNLSILLQIQAQKIVRRIHRNYSYKLIEKRDELNKKIKKEIIAQGKDYSHYKYFMGFPYQALDIVNVFGARPTEIRFDEYHLRDILKSTDKVLDIGTNCGFMAIISSYRTGCEVDGIDINEYMINIGNHVSEYLNIADRVKLSACKFQDFSSEKKYNVVFSFATHWTDDKQYRVTLEEHLMRIYNLLDVDGTLVFESHTADIGNELFYKTLDGMRDRFSWNESELLENGTRELFIMKKVSK